MIAPNKSVSIMDQTRPSFPSGFLFAKQHAMRLC